MDKFLIPFGATLAVNYVLASVFFYLAVPPGSDNALAKGLDVDAFELVPVILALAVLWLSLS